MKVVVLGAGLMGKEIARDLVASVDVDKIYLADVNTGPAQEFVTSLNTDKSEPIENKMNQFYDAYVFFSPLSFLTFVKNNQIPSESVIFTVGKTTTKAVEEVYKNHTIITANIPLVDVVVNQIKDSINDKK